MKDKLTHEVEILGRSVSVLLLIGLIMAAGASAALLDSFGTVEGEVDVEEAAIDVAGSQSFTFDPTTAGDTTVSDSFNYHSNQDQTVPVSITTQVDDVEKEGESDLGYEDPADVEGVDVDHLVYNQWNTSGDGYDVSVSAAEDQDAETGYSISFTGQDSSDYAIAWFDTSSLDLSTYDTITYDGERATDEDGVNDNPFYDEAWVVTASGDSYWQHSGSNTGGFDLTSKFTNGTDSITPTSKDIVAVGVGQGSPQATPDYDVDITIEDVRVTGDGTEYLEARTDGLRLAPNTYEEQDLTIRYGTAIIADLAMNAKPGDYGLKTTVDLAE